MTTPQESAPGLEPNPKTGMIDKGQRLGEIALRWWRDLQPHEKGNQRGGANRAALAKLRRCSTWLEAVAEPETASLFNRLGGGDEKRLQRVAVLASVLAHVREEEVPKVATSIGPQKADDEKSALFSRLRLRRFLTATSDDDVLTAFRRLVAIKGGQANVADLAPLILSWDSEKTRMRFAFDYWQAGAAAPDAASSSANGDPDNV